MKIGDIVLVMVDEGILRPAIVTFAHSEMVVNATVFLEPHDTPREWSRDFRKEIYKGEGVNQWRLKEEE